ncbi:MAG: chorismate--pyruvate lyase family protein, partial [Candidatus Syntropharchaeia archaeon]
KNLSKFQKILLMTDGSVTTLLEIYTGNPVKIKTLHQKIIPATHEIANKLEIDVGDEVNERIVLLLDSNENPLIHARSYTPIQRTSEGFREDLLRADVPIGKILKKHRIEFRRELNDIWEEESDEEMKKIFGDERLLVRNYNIIHRNKILITIWEKFPKSSFV